jgi:hypothetical protein
VDDGERGRRPLGAAGFRDRRRRDAGGPQFSTGGRVDDVPARSLELVADGVSAGEVALGAEARALADERLSLRALRERCPRPSRPCGL